MKLFQYAGLLSAAFLGGFAANMIMTPEAASAQDKKEAAGKTLSANEFILKSKDGKTKARLGLDAEGTPELSFTDMNGKSHSMLKNVDEYSRHAKHLDALRKEVKDVATRAEIKDNKVRVSHILISFDKAPRATVKRTKEEAELLAAFIYSEIKAGKDFDELQKKYSDDPGGGTYTMVLKGQAGPGEFARNGMVPAFGNVGWKLSKVGDVSVAGHDARNSPFGWHIIKRVELQK